MGIKMSSNSPMVCNGYAKHMYTVTVSKLKVINLLLYRKYNCRAGQKAARLRQGLLNYGIIAYSVSVFALIEQRSTLYYLSLSRHSLGLPISTLQEY